MAPASPLSPVVMASPQGRDLCHQGQEEARAGRRIAAIEAFRRGLSTDPDLTDCRAALATLLLREFRWQEAEAEFREGLRRGAEPPRRAVLLVGLGETLEREGKLAEAVRSYEEALAIEARSPRALGHLAIARRASGDLEGTVSAWQAYLDARPRDSAAVERLEEAVRLEAELRLLEEKVKRADAAPEDWDELARARRSAADLAGVLGARRSAAEKAPRDAGRQLALALAELEAGHAEAARQALEKTLDLDPDRTAAYAQLARLAEVRSDRVSERRVWQRLADRHPFDLVAQRRLVELDEIAGAPALARTEAEAARHATESGSGAAPALRLTLVRLAAGDRSGAESAMALALERAPNEPALLIAVGDLIGAPETSPRRRARAAGVSTAGGRGDEAGATGIGRTLLAALSSSRQGPAGAAVESLSALAAAHPERADLRVALGTALLGAARVDEARRELARAQEIAPGEAMAALALAQAALHDGQYDEARRQAQSVLSRSPRDPFALEVLAMAAFRQGDREQAEAAARAALEVDPWEEAAGSRFLLARLLAARGDLRAAEEIVRGDLPAAAWIMYDQAWAFARDLFLGDLPPARWESWRRKAGDLSGGDEEALPRIAALLASLEERYTRLRTPEETLDRYFSRRPDSPTLVAGKTPEANRAVIARRLSENLAYLKLADFQSPEVAAVVRQVLEGLKDAPGLVLDLRGNAGGLKDEAEKVAGMLVPPDTLLEVEKGREGASEVRSRLGDEVYPTDRPLVVLVDENTASAAEALASMLQSSGRATVVGDPTRGKGVSQAVRLLPGGYSVLVTASQILDPSGRPLQGRGVVPQFPVQEHDEASDPALEKARELLEPHP